MQPTVTHAEAPRHIGRYRVVGTLGAGGMGTVYRVHDPELNREVALKVPHFSGPPEQRAQRAARFQREARAAARVLHPNVCPIFDVGEHDGAPYVVMALVEGESLAGRLAREGRLESVGEATGLALQLLDALAAVHAQGVVHRDVKPGNVLLDRSGRPVLTDFGLARDGDGAEPLTAEGVVLGTPAYMAPEQAGGRADQVGPATDLYALGVVLYQVLTGRLPFEGEPLAVLHRIVHEPPPPPRQFRPELPPALEAAVLRALAKGPAQRFPDARAFAAALSGAEEAPPTRAPATAPAAPGPPTGTKAGRPRWAAERALGWLAGGVLVAGGAMLVCLPLTHALSGEMFAEEQPIGRSYLVPTLAVTFLALLAAWLGTLVWQLTESYFTAEGLLAWAKVGNARAVGKALAVGAPPDARDEVGSTALMRAAAAGHAEVAARLLLHGADPGLRDPFGQTALDVARAAGRANVVALLSRSPPPPAGPPPAPVRRPHPLLGLVVFAALGALVAGVLWMRSSAHLVPREEFLALAGAGELARVERIREYVFAERKGASPRTAWRGRKVYVGPLPDAQRLVNDLRGRGAPVVGDNMIYVGWNVNGQVWPGDWVLVALAAAAAAFFALVFAPLLRVPSLYPMFPRRRTPSPG